MVVSGTSLREAGHSSRPTATRALDAASYGPDSDGDGIPDSLEQLILTNPNQPDSDRDQFPDGLEIVLGSDPLDPSSRPNLAPPGYIDGPVFSIQNFAAPAAQPAKQN